MKIPVRKLIERISKYDFVSFGFVVDAAESILEMEKIQKDLADDNESRRGNG